MGKIRRGAAAQSRGPPVLQRPPKSERRSLRSGAKSETCLTRAPLPPRACAASREVSSRISSVASCDSRCGTAGPPSTERWRSRRVLVALLPHVIAGTRALLRTVICSMSLPTRTRAPGPGQVNPIAPPRRPCIPVAGFTFPVRRLTTTPRIHLIPGRVGHMARGSPCAAAPRRNSVHAAFCSRRVDVGYLTWLLLWRNAPLRMGAPREPARARDRRTVPAPFAPRRGRHGHRVAGP